MLPREIQAEHDQDQSRFNLPTRPIGWMRLAGLVPMGFAVLFAWMPAQQILHFLGKLVSGNGHGIEWFVVAFLSIFVVVAFMPFSFGLFILTGRTRLVVRQDRIVVTELAGPIRKSRKVMLNQIERLEVGGPKAEGNPGLFSSLCGITAILKDGKKKPLAVGYPREWLQPLAEEIRSAMQYRGATVAVEEAKLTSLAEGQPVETEQRLEKPADSLIEASASGWGVELKVPSRGLFKESYGLLVFGIFWCAIVGVVTAAGLFGKNSSGGMLAGIGFLAAFWAIGLGMLLFGIHLGSRRWTLQADRSQLQVKLKSALRSREWHWAADEIEDVRLGDSGTKVNDRALEQLQIHTRACKKTGLLTGRNHDELAWVATTLRGALGVQTGESTEAPPRIDPSQRRR